MSMTKKLALVFFLLAVVFVWFSSTLTAGSENYWIIVPFIMLIVAIALVLDSLMSSKD